MNEQLKEYSKAIERLSLDENFYPRYKKIQVRDAIQAYGLENEIAQRVNQKLPLRSFAFWIHGWVWGPISSPNDLLAYNVDKNINILVRNNKEKKYSLITATKKFMQLAYLLYIQAQKT